MALRHAMAARAAGGPPLEEPYDDLVRQIGQAAYKVTLCSFMTLLSLTPGAEIPAVGTSVPLVDHGDHC